MNLPWFRLDTHDAEEVPIGCAHVNLRLNQRLPLLDERAELVAGEVHPVEVGQHGSALDILAAQLHLPVPLANKKINGRTRGKQERAEVSTPERTTNQRSVVLLVIIRAGFKLVLVSFWPDAVRKCRVSYYTPPSSGSHDKQSSSGYKYVS